MKHPMRISFILKRSNTFLEYMDGKNRHRREGEPREYVVYLKRGATLYGFAEVDRVLLTSGGPLNLEILNWER